MFGGLVFEGPGQCTACHGGATFTDANERLHPVADSMAEPEAPSYASRSGRLIRIRRPANRDSGALRRQILATRVGQRIAEAVDCFSAGVIVRGRHATSMASANRFVAFARNQPSRAVDFAPSRSTN